jgi:hypothetical protein
MRAVAVLVACAALAACSDEGANPILARGVEAVTARVRSGPEAPAAESAARPAVLTRADIEASGAAAIRVRLIGSSSAGSVFYGAVENNGVVSYVTPLRETVGMRGSQVVSTRGLGTDLLRSWSSPHDPLARPVPVDEWPATVERSYELPGTGARGEVRSFVCRFDFGPVRTITILEREHRGVEVRETCTGPSGSFEQIHIADVETGFVWHTLQWTGPEQGVVDVAVIEPVT